jgi:hypothetical protein
LYRYNADADEGAAAAANRSAVLDGMHSSLDVLNGSNNNSDVYGYGGGFGCEGGSAKEGAGPHDQRWGCTS